MKNHALKKLFLVSLALVACAGPRITGPGINNRRAKALWSDAAQQLQCPASELTGTFVQSIEDNLHAYTVEGCGRQATALLHCMGGLCRWRETPEQRAMMELQCPREQLTRQLQGNRFIITGCGQTRAYGFVRGHLVPVVLNLPTAAATPAPVASVELTVGVLADGRLTLDAGVITREALQRAFEDARARSPDSAVVVQTDDGVPQALVLEVLDLARAAGLTRVSFSAHR